LLIFSPFYSPQHVFLVWYYTLKAPKNSIAGCITTKTVHYYYDLPIPDVLESVLDVDSDDDISLPLELDSAAPADVFCGIGAPSAVAAVRGDLTESVVSVLAFDSEGT